jgi:polyketide biosynthesis enoyl-CoA hydratase PksI
MEQIIFLSEVNSGIALIRMEDRVNKNTFTKEFIEQFYDTMKKAENDERFKVIVLTGFDNYFLSGGTQEALLDIQAGRSNFLNTGDKGNLYSLPLDCKLPVIAAMQGHAIGGGLSLGLFADVVILAKESIYTASFMKYGFTPGFGSTYIFPKKLGVVLGSEMLLSARRYHGEELEKRGIPFEVCRRKDVLNHALEIADLLAEKPRQSLIVLKENLVKEMRDAVPQAIEKELVLHDITFHLPEVREKLFTLYDN